MPLAPMRLVLAADSFRAIAPNVLVCGHTVSTRTNDRDVRGGSPGGVYQNLWNWGADSI